MYNRRAGVVTGIGLQPPTPMYNGVTVAAVDPQCGCTSQVPTRRSAHNDRPQGQRSGLRCGAHPVVPHCRCTIPASQGGIGSSAPTLEIMSNEGGNEARNEGPRGSNGGGPGPGWRAVSELAEVLCKPSALLRQYIHRAYRNEVGNVEDDVVRYVARPSGGRPEMWVAPAVVALLERHYRVPPTQPNEVAFGVRNEVADEADNEVCVVATVDASKDDPLLDWARVPVSRLVELERRAAIVEVLEGEVERLGADRLKLETERDEARHRATDAERRADLAETLTRRARGEADRWRADAESIRLAWHMWRRALDGVGRWSLLRRRLPPEPPEFTAGSALTRTDG